MPSTTCPQRAAIAHLALLLLAAALAPASAASGADETPTTAVCHRDTDEQGRLSFVTSFQEGAADEATRKETGICLRDLVPSKSRWFRGISFSYSGLDQPNMLFDSMGMPTPNPDAELRKYEASLDLSKVFWSTDELVAAYQLAAGDDTRSLVSATGFDARYVGAAHPLKFFARARKKDALRRFASAWSFSTAQSERKDVGVSGDDYEDTYAVTFDPKRFLISSDRVLKAYQGLAAYAKVHDVASGLKPVSLTDDPIEVLHTVSGLPVLHQLKVALIPTIEWSTVDQFDFLAVGSLFVPSPLIEESIETIKITWNLSTALDTTAKRRAAISAIALHQKIRKEETATILPAQKKPEKFCVGDYLYRQHSVQARPAIQDGRWSAEGLPQGLNLQRNGLLVGILEKPGEQTFQVSVKGTAGKGPGATHQTVEEDRTFVVEACS